MILATLERERQRSLPITLNVIHQRGAPRACEQAEGAGHLQGHPGRTNGDPLNSR